jgi:diaminopimelate epimerase
MKFWKYHALGNDYLVMDGRNAADPLTPERIRTICHRNFGIGSDGILLRTDPSGSAAFALRIFNPDGSEAEKSGNGIRIFARFLWDQQLVRGEEFILQTLGGQVKATVQESGKLVRVEMGQISFSSQKIPVSGPAREVINEPISVGDRSFVFCAATIGNPHCVIPVDALSPDLARHFGPLLEVHPFFPNRTNVQFMRVIDRNNIQIEIWERGAGYTLASGSSSSAAASVARKLGLCDDSITVHMPGGPITIQISPDYSILMTGPVTRVGEGVLSNEMFAAAR